MQKFQFKTYQRNDPTVRALQFEPGMESAWAAFDIHGRVLGSASTQEHARQAAPNAVLVAPIIDLPGLSVEPLVFGSYFVEISADLVVQMSAKDFEAAYTDKFPAVKIASAK